MGKIGVEESVYRPEGCVCMHVCVPPHLVGTETTRSCLRGDDDDDERRERREKREKR